MKITALAFTPPPSASNNPKVTPELCASTLARYSRSNKGIDSILSSVNWNDPDKSVDSILKFVDYGHASIAGMTGGIPVIIDGCSMFLAYKLFEIAQLCDGQESSTRYIKLDASNIPLAEEIGIPQHLAIEWTDLMQRSFAIFHDLYTTLDKQALEHPELIRIPHGADAKIIDRMRKNYALDRCRYFIPFATKTNAAFIMTARVWAETIKILDSLPLEEAHSCAAGIRSELVKFTPRLMRHSFPDAASIAQAKQMIHFSVTTLKSTGFPVSRCQDEVYVHLDQNVPPFLPALQSTSDAFEGKTNRYSTLGSTIKRMTVRAAWNNIAIAELRDLNRHRSGFRFSPLVPVGFYLPDGISHQDTSRLLQETSIFIQKLLQCESSAAAYVYALHLGTQVTFEHTTQLDKFIYEIELRTGIGAHFRYAEHLNAANIKLCEAKPDLQPFITIGTAEPE